MADENKAAGAEPARRTVYVRAVPREKFDGFFRLGRKFSPSEWTKLDVTHAELAQLREVPQMLVTVDQRPGDYVEPTPVAPAAPEVTAPGAPEAGVLQPGAPPGAVPPVDNTYRQGEGGPSPHDPLGQAEVRGAKPQGRR
ncbi:MAG TPA: hypothetical protein VFS43_28895 [Polyangiaceae bacterium]|nr:hypothetical protein [Polyangiaceae bacterium]